MELQYRDIFKYRSVWMGIAILWVTVYHSSLSLSWILPWKVLGYGGVDIFFFASGLGCYYSLHKQSDPFLFMAKRLKRILPPYYFVLVFWLSIHIFVFQISFTPVEILSNLFCTGTFCGADHQFNWYVSGVWLSYLLAPLFVSYIDRSTGLRRVFPVIVLFLISVTFLPFSWNMSLSFTRLPIFYIGMLFSKSAQEKNSIAFRKAVGWIFLSIVGTTFLLFCNENVSNHLSDWGLYWYPFIFIVPGLCMLISLLCVLIQRYSRWPIYLFSNIGTCSFELYLIHITIFSFFDQGYLPQTNNILWCAIIIFCCLFAVLLRKFIHHFIHN